MNEKTIWDEVLAYISDAKEKLAELPEDDQLADKIHSRLEAIETDIHNAGK